MSHNTWDRPTQQTAFYMSLQNITITYKHKHLLQNINFAETQPPGKSRKEFALFEPFEACSPFWTVPWLTLQQH